MTRAKPQTMAQVLRDATAAEIEGIAWAIKRVPREWFKPTTEDDINEIARRRAQMGKLK